MQRDPDSAPQQTAALLSWYGSDNNGESAQASIAVAATSVVLTN